jgi:hypothetical protein
MDLLVDLFDVDTVEAIKKIRIPLVLTQDKLIWIKDPKGIFSTKSAYGIIQDHVKGNHPSVQWQNLWKMKYQNSKQKMKDNKRKNLEYLLESY